MALSGQGRHAVGRESVHLQETEARPHRGAQSSCPPELLGAFYDTLVSNFHGATQASNIERGDPQLWRCPSYYPLLHYRLPKKLAS